MKTIYRIWTGQRMLSYRLKKKLNQQQMADKIKIKRCTYASYEEGRAEPSIFTLKKFCKSVRTSIDKFMEGSPEKEMQQC
jgi:transcriptional regulator with XRE-family HTH domain